MAGIVVQKDNTRMFIWRKGGTVAAGDKMGNITDIGDVGGETEDIDTTTIDSLAKESESGFADNGTIDVTQNVTQLEYITMDTLRKMEMTSSGEFPHLIRLRSRLSGCTAVVR